MVTLEVLKKLVCVMLLGSLLPGHASAGEREQPNLADSVMWRKLVHYEPVSAGKASWRSAIHSERFFLAGDLGRDSPERELQATIAALQEAATGNPDEHARCRFPARAMWLAREMGESLRLAAVQCPQRDQWTRGQQVESVSIVLATGFLANPASYYGHTLLKLNLKGQLRVSDLQDLSVNYGAIGTGADDPLTYMVKGVFGGYEGGFSQIQYHFHRRQYGDEELRDLWEYELNLAPQEVDLVVAHAWEVLGQTYDYYFFRRNCAYRMAELIEVVEGLDVTPGGRPWTIPQSVLQKLAKARRSDGTPLVRSVRHQPSRQSEFYDAYQALSDAEQDIFGDLALSVVRPSDPRFEFLTMDRRRAVLDAVLHYHQFAAEPSERATGRLPQAYDTALAERYRLPPGRGTATQTLPAPPHLGRNPGWVQLNWSESSSGQQRALLRVRPAYYDPLDAEASHVRNAGLAMGEVRLSLRSGQLGLEQLDLISIESVNPGVSGLPGDNGKTWRLKAGVEPLLPGCADCRVVRLQGDVGWGRSWRSEAHVAAMVGGAVQEDRLGQGHGFFRLTLTGVWRPSAQWGFRGQQEFRRAVANQAGNARITQMEVRWQWGRDSDLRMMHELSQGEGRRHHQTMLGWGHYW